ncbi:MAG: SUMF1/EgtB/PvdO family nonheme iron enzyme [Thermoanaerobaculia bacterium]|nr:MAG: SUMF1/EgtB/PvdO family nonheme iron enzyme [Thermoanaerobaculia bacterium]
MRTRLPRAGHPGGAALIAVLALSELGAAPAGPGANALRQRNDELLAEMAQGLALTDSQLVEVRGIFARSRYLGQGNPAITVHPMSPETCRQRAASGEPSIAGDRDFEAICGAKFMAPLYDPARESAAAAGACIDQYEFPSLPCVYPVVWVRAREAAELCAAVGKRLCDAHEWEGACAGSLQPPDYRFELARGVAPAAAVARMRAASNRVEDARKVWAYGAAYRTGVCAAASTKTAGCNGGNWGGCGSNTYPAGAFPECRSPLGVYDLHGNAAEHMNLPLDPSQMASRGSDELGVTEMKGSWFIFDRYRAHEDACRWRAPYWHGSRVMDPGSHQNYHLGFRCCKSLAPGTSGPSASGGAGR